MKLLFRLNENLMKAADHDLCLLMLQQQQRDLRDSREWRGKQCLMDFFACHFQDFFVSLQLQLQRSAQLSKLNNSNKKGVEATE